jgi:hypothetical protein
MQSGTSRQEMDLKARIGVKIESQTPLFDADAAMSRIENR